MSGLAGRFPEMPMRMCVPCPLRKGQKCSPICGVGALAVQRSGMGPGIAAAAAETRLHKSRPCRAGSRSNESAWGRRKRPHFQWLDVALLRKRGRQKEPWPILPSWPRQRPGNIDDVIARRGRILLVPGNTKPDLQIDATHRPKFEVAVGQILRPFRRKADTKAG